MEVLAEETIILSTGGGSKEMSDQVYKMLKELLAKSQSNVAVYNVWSNTLESLTLAVAKHCYKVDELELIQDCFFPGTRRKGGVKALRRELDISYHKLLLEMQNSGGNGGKQDNSGIFRADMYKNYSVGGENADTRAAGDKNNDNGYGYEAVAPFSLFSKKSMCAVVKIVEDCYKKRKIPVESKMVVNDDEIIIYERVGGGVGIYQKGMCEHKSHLQVRGDDTQGEDTGEDEYSHNVKNKSAAIQKKQSLSQKKNRNQQEGQYCNEAGEYYYENGSGAETGQEPSREKSSENEPVAVHDNGNFRNIWDVEDIGDINIVEFSSNYHMYFMCGVHYDSGEEYYEKDDGDGYEENSINNIPGESRKYDQEANKSRMGNKKKRKNRKMIVDFSRKKIIAEMSDGSNLVAQRKRNEEYLKGELLNSISSGIIDERNGTFIPFIVPTGKYSEIYDLVMGVADNETQCDKCRKSKSIKNNEALAILIGLWDKWWQLVTVGNTIRSVGVDNNARLIIVRGLVRAWRIVTCGLDRVDYSNTQLVDFIKHKMGVDLRVRYSHLIFNEIERINNNVILMGFPQSGSLYNNENANLDYKKNLVQSLIQGVSLVFGRSYHNEYPIPVMFQAYYSKLTLKMLLLYLEKLEYFKKTFTKLTAIKNSKSDLVVDNSGYDVKHGANSITTITSDIDTAGAVKDIDTGINTKNTKKDGGINNVENADTSAELDLESNKNYVMVRYIMQVLLESLESIYVHDVPGNEILLHTLCMVVTSQYTDDIKISPRLLTSILTLLGTILTTISTANISNPVGSDRVGQGSCESIEDEYVLFNKNYPVAKLVQKNTNVSERNTGNDSNNSNNDNKRVEAMNIEVKVEYKLINIKHEYESVAYKVCEKLDSINCELFSMYYAPKEIDSSSRFATGKDSRRKFTSSNVNFSGDRNGGDISKNCESRKDKRQKLRQAKRHELLAAKRGLLKILGYIIMLTVKVNKAVVANVQGVKGNSNGTAKPPDVLHTGKSRLAPITFIKRLVVDPEGIFEDLIDTEDIREDNEEKKQEKKREIEERESETVDIKRYALFLALEGLYSMDTECVGISIDTIGLVLDVQRYSLSSHANKSENNDQKNVYGDENTNSNVLDDEEEFEPSTVDIICRHIVSSFDEQLKRFYYYTLKNPNNSDYFLYNEVESEGENYGDDYGEGGGEGDGDGGINGSGVDSETGLKIDDLRLKRAKVACDLLLLLLGILKAKPRYLALAVEDAEMQSLGRAQNQNKNKNQNQKHSQYIKSTDGFRGNNKASNNIYEKTVCGENVSLFDMLISSFTFKFENDPDPIIFTAGKLNNKKTKDTGEDIHIVHGYKLEKSRNSRKNASKNGGKTENKLPTTTLVEYGVSKHPKQLIKAKLVVGNFTNVMSTLNQNERESRGNSNIKKGGQIGLSIRERGMVWINDIIQVFLSSFLPMTHFEKSFTVALEDQSKCYAAGNKENQDDDIAAINGSLLMMGENVGANVGANADAGANANAGANAGSYTEIKKKPALVLGYDHNQIFTTVYSNTDSALRSIDLTVRSQFGKNTVYMYNTLQSNLNPYSKYLNQPEFQPSSKINIQDSTQHQTQEPSTFTTTFDCQDKSPYNIIPNNKNKDTGVNVNGTKIEPVNAELPKVREIKPSGIDWDYYLELNSIDSDVQKLVSQTKTRVNNYYSALYPDRQNSPLSTTATPPNDMGPGTPNPSAVSEQQDASNTEPSALSGPDINTDNSVIPISGDKNSGNPNMIPAQHSVGENDTSISDDGSDGGSGGVVGSTKKNIKPNSRNPFAYENFRALIRHFELFDLVDALIGSNSASKVAQLRQENDGNDDDGDNDGDGDGDNDGDDDDENKYTESGKVKTGIRSRLEITRKNILAGISELGSASSEGECDGQGDGQGGGQGEGEGQGGGEDSDDVFGIDGALDDENIEHAPYIRLRKKLRLKIQPIRLSEQLVKDLQALDRMASREQIKIGLLYVQPKNQTNAEEILANEIQNTTNTYRDFITRFGRFVDLMTFEGYVGKLSNKPLVAVGDSYDGGGEGEGGGADGRYTLYFDTPSEEVCIHDATLMPSNRVDDPKLISKKRHIGNDFVHVVWNSHASFPYRPETISGDFGNVVIIISPLTANNSTYTTTTSSNSSNSNSTNKSIKTSPSQQQQQQQQHQQQQQRHTSAIKTTEKYTPRFGIRIFQLPQIDSFGGLVDGMVVDMPTLVRLLRTSVIKAHRLALYALIPTVQHPVTLRHTAIRTLIDRHKQDMFDLLTQLDPVE